jgi:hypothetical protein
MAGNRREFLKPVSVLAALLLSSTAQCKAAVHDETVLAQQPSLQSTNIAEKELLVLNPENPARAPSHHHSHGSHGSHRSHFSHHH